jgi:hypothetical protein
MNDRIKILKGKRKYNEIDNNKVSKYQYKIFKYSENK